MEACLGAGLLRRCASDDQDPWTELTARFGARLEAGVRRALRRAGWQASSDQIEDFLQDVYCRLLERDRRALHRFRGASEGEAAAYLRRIAETVTLDALRQAAAAKRGGEHPAADAVDLDNAPSRTASPEDELLARERWAELATRCAAAAGRHAARRNRWILRKALVEGWSSREISAGLGGGLTPGSVDSIVARARRRLAREGLALRRRAAAPG